MDGKTLKEKIREKRARRIQGIARYDTMPAFANNGVEQAEPSTRTYPLMTKSVSADSFNLNRSPTESFTSTNDSSIDSFDPKAPVRRWTGTGRDFKGGAREKPAICPICHNLKLDHEIFLDEARAVRLNLFDLAESAFEGDCKWCALIYRSMAELGASLPSPESSGFVRIMAKPGESFLAEWVSNTRLTAEIYKVRDHEDEIKALGAAPNVAADIGKQSVFAAIRQWLKTCDKDHTGCVQKPTPPPRRLLDIGMDWEDGRPKEMRLIQDRREPAKYLAFSHRWGLLRHFTTTKSTLKDRLTSISWNDLPVSYRDAVTVAHELEVRYIWIDSLCIVQDDTEDWEDQSKKLADIFEESYLTIAAALSPGDETGFLQSSSEREEYLGQIIDLTDFGIPNGSVKARTIHDFRTVKTAHTLDGRAWTLQETLFPPRLLTFSVLVYLECRTTSFCECGHDLFPDPFCGKVTSFDKVDRRIFNELLRRPEKSAALEYWHKTIIPDYSRRQLTNAKDRLPAVSALALRFEAKLNDRYLAGLWRENIPLQLAWSVQTMGISNPQRAPSWSWASVEGPIEWLSWYFVINGSSLSSRMTLLGIDNIETPRCSVLTVTAKMCSAWLELSLIDMFAFQAKLDREDKGELTFQLEPGKAPYMFDTPLTEGITTWSNEATIQRHPGEATESANVMCSLVRCLLLFEALHEKLVRRVFLILTPSTQNPGVYRRIGVFSLERHETEVDAHAWYFSDDGFEDDTVRLE